MESSRIVVKNRREKLVFVVGSDTAGNTSETSINSIHSHVGVTSEDSAGMVITISVEIFFDIHIFRLGVSIGIMSTGSGAFLGKGDDR